MDDIVVADTVVNIVADTVESAVSNTAGDTADTEYTLGDVLER